MARLKFEIIKMGKPNKLVWQHLAFRMLWGAWCMFFIAWTRDSWIAYPLAIAFGLLFGAAMYGTDLWRRRALDMTDRYRDLLNYCNQRTKVELDATVHRLIQECLADTSITNYTIQVNDRGLSVKIGDDDVMVPVDAAKLGEDAVAALEEAHMAWLAAKGQPDGRED